MPTFLRFLAAGLLLTPAALGAQGTVSAQGLGYPPGQLSTQSLGTGGSTAEFDPLSPLNPAALIGSPTTQLFVQYEPESRRTSAGGATDRSTVNRFPLMGAAARVGGRLGLGLHISTLADRSWATSTRGTEESGAAFQETFESRGAVTDVRGAAAWRFGPTLSVGVAAHLYTGENLLEIGRFYDDPQWAGFRQNSRLDYAGAGGSAGVVWMPARHVGVALSGRVGGTLRARQSDRLVGEATIPARAGASLRYTGLAGAVIALRGDWQGWSSVNDLGTALDGRDVWDFGVGAEMQGPRFGGSLIPLRLGARLRELPFAVNGEAPRETAFSAGAGVPFARGRVVLDLGVQRASRSAGDARETAWTFSTGLVVRP